MKLHQIAVAVAVLAAGSASAATVTFTVSGATALNKSFEKTALDMCNTTVASATYSTAGGAKPAVRYQCTAKSGLGIAGVNAGDTLIINKEQGGSSHGVKPVNNSTPVTVATTTCTTSTVDPVFPNRTHWTGCGATTAVPTAGVSDVEPKLVSTAAADYANLNNAGIVAQVFGMAVSDNVYRQLQAIQGLSDVNATTFDPANAPSLPASFVRGAFAGAAADWTAVSDQIVADSDRSGENHPNQTAWDDAGVNTTEIKVCRRATGSGTLASFEATVMAQPCGTSPTYGGATGLSSFSGDNTTLNDTNKAFLGETDVYTVVEHGQQEGVDTCLTQAYYQGEMAIAIMGTERQSGDTGSKISGSDDNDGVQDKWHYVKIGQVYPSVENFVAGDYDFYWAEASFNRRKTGYTNTETNLMNYFANKMGDPVAIVDIPLPGLAALTSNGYTFDYGVSPVARASRGGNTCSMGVQTY
ncbi:hypothetical protein Tbd_0353 [Thiobacillus denitrificans ATCC 25259]|uniref:PBP domain-containing protein n=1 Tax=Thiobacillus denitrificans (strain ATCC 25259 / T1) TaxID=292415 RepID=Q3SLU7_THIDA|nr:hypothetical protein [Thiobacillus denitrificans]AAZ96306.1 hypothetical protein Tbd_0353 [Thiobacillus denitrificans ATCC 25259]